MCLDIRYPQNQCGVIVRGERYKRVPIKQINNLIFPSFVEFTTYICPPVTEWFSLSSLLYFLFLHWRKKKEAARLRKSSKLVLSNLWTKEAFSQQTHPWILVVADPPTALIRRE
jgi:hypothetical protein